MNENKGYTINDKRGREEPKPCCRVCGAKEEHSANYNKPTMDCIEHLRKKVTFLKIEFAKFDPKNPALDI